MPPKSILNSSRRGSRTRQSTQSQSDEEPYYLQTPPKDTTKPPPISTRKSVVRRQSRAFASVQQNDESGGELKSINMSKKLPATIANTAQENDMTLLNTLHLPFELSDEQNEDLSQYSNIKSSKITSQRNKKAMPIAKASKSAKTPIYQDVYLGLPNQINFFNPQNGSTDCETCQEDKNGPDDQNQDEINHISSTSSRSRSKNIVPRDQKSPILNPSEPQPQLSSPTVNRHQSHHKRFSRGCLSTCRTFTKITITSVSFIFSMLLFQLIIIINSYTAEEQLSPYHTPLTIATTLILLNLALLALYFPAHLLLPISQSQISMKLKNNKSITDNGGRSSSLSRSKKVQPNTPYPKHNKHNPTHEEAQTEPTQLNISPASLFSNGLLEELNSPIRNPLHDLSNSINLILSPGSNKENQNQDINREGTKMSKKNKSINSSPPQEALDAEAKVYLKHLAQDVNQLKVCSPVHLSDKDKNTVLPHSYLIQCILKLNPFSHFFQISNENFQQEQQEKQEQQQEQEQRQDQFLSLNAASNSNFNLDNNEFSPIKPELHANLNSTSVHIHVDSFLDSLFAQGETDSSDSTPFTTTTATATSINNSSPMDNSPSIRPSKSLQSSNTDEDDHEDQDLSAFIQNELSPIFNNISNDELDPMDELYTLFPDFQEESNHVTPFASQSITVSQINQSILTNATTQPELKRQPSRIEHIKHTPKKRGSLPSPFEGRKPTFNTIIDEAIFFLTDFSATDVTDNQSSRLRNNSRSRSNTITLGNAENDDEELLPIFRSNVPTTTLAHKGRTIHGEYDMDAVAARYSSQSNFSSLENHNGKLSSDSMSNPTSSIMNYLTSLFSLSDDEDDSEFNHESNNFDTVDSPCPKHELLMSSSSATQKSTIPLFFRIIFFPVNLLIKLYLKIRLFIFLPILLFFLTLIILPITTFILGLFYSGDKQKNDPPAESTNLSKIQHRRSPSPPHFHPDFPPITTNSTHQSYLRRNVSLNTPSSTYANEPNLNTSDHLDHDEDSSDFYNNISDSTDIDASSFDHNLTPFSTNSHHSHRCHNQVNTALNSVREEPVNVPSNFAQDQPRHPLLSKQQPKFPLYDQRAASHLSSLKLASFTPKATTLHAIGACLASTFIFFTFCAVSTGFLHHSSLSQMKHAFSSLQPIYYCVHILFSKNMILPFHYQSVTTNLIEYTETSLVVFFFCNISLSIVFLELFTRWYFYSTFLPQSITNGDKQQTQHPKKNFNQNFIIKLVTYPLSSPLVFRVLGYYVILSFLTYFFLVSPLTDPLPLPTLSSHTETPIFDHISQQLPLYQRVALSFVLHLPSLIVCSAWTFYLALFFSLFFIIFIAFEFLSYFRPSMKFFFPIPRTLTQFTQINALFQSITYGIGLTFATMICLTLFSIVLFIPASTLAAYNQTLQYTLPNQIIYHLLSNSPSPPFSTFLPTNQFTGQSILQREVFLFNIYQLSSSATYVIAGIILAFTLILLWIREFPTFIISSTLSYTQLATAATYNYNSASISATNTNQIDPSREDLIPKTIPFFLTTLCSWTRIALFNFYLYPICFISLPIVLMIPQLFIISPLHNAPVALLSQLPSQHPLFNFSPTAVLTNDLFKVPNLIFLLLTPVLYILASLPHLFSSLVSIFSSSSASRHRSTYKHPLSKLLHFFNSNHHANIESNGINFILPFSATSTSQELPQNTSWSINLDFPRFSTLPLPLHHILVFLQQMSFTWLIFAFSQSFQLALFFMVIQTIFFFYQFNPYWRTIKIG